MFFIWEISQACIVAFWDFEGRMEYLWKVWALSSVLAFICTVVATDIAFRTRPPFFLWESEMGEQLLLVVLGVSFIMVFL